VVFHESSKGTSHFAQHVKLLNAAIFKPLLDLKISNSNKITTPSTTTWRQMEFNQENAINLQLFARFHHTH